MQKTSLKCDREILNISLAFHFQFALTNPEILIRKLPPLAFVSYVSTLRDHPRALKRSSLTLKFYVKNKTKKKPQKKLKKLKYYTYKI